MVRELLAGKRKEEIQDEGQSLLLSSVEESKVHSRLNQEEEGLKNQAKQ
jgi:hypothetical protein